MFKFYKTIFHPDLLKNFITVDFLNNLLFFLSAFFIAAFAYTINVSFPDDELKNYQTSAIITFFLEFSFVYIFIIIFFIELLSSNLMYQKDNLQLKDINLKLVDKNKNTVVKLIKDADKYIQEKKYYDALERLQEALILVPDYAEAEERVDFVSEELAEKNEKKLKELNKKGIESFNNKQYIEALEYFDKYLDIKPEDKEILKYINLTEQEINIIKKEKRYLKDKYNYKVRMNRKLLSKQKIKIHNLIEKGKKELKKKNFVKAKDLFKKVLVIDVNNFDAFYYINKAN